MGDNKEKKKTNVKKNTNSKTNMSSNNRNKNKKVLKDEDIEILDKTNSFEIIIDDERLKDKETLDFSFIDGKNKRKKAKNEMEFLEEEYYKEAAKNIDSDILKPKGNDFFSTAVIIILAFILGFLICCIWAKKSNYFSEVKTVVEEVEKVVMDDNYVFVGDSIFEGYKLESHFKDMPVVNSGVSGNKTTDILNNMNNRIYRYNPSKVFLLIGTNDIGNIASSKTVENIAKIIDNIKTNRTYAEIYVFSIYPVNKEVDGWSAPGVRDNEVIKAINKDIKEVCSKKEVNFIDVYDLLADGDGNLKESYSYDGLHLTEDGYQVITKEINKVLK